MSVPVPETLGLNWRKASRSATTGECVEVATACGQVAIRDSKNPQGLMLSCSADAWRSFLAVTKQHVSFN